MTGTKRAPVSLTNAFIGKTEPPTEREVTAVLGAAKALWEQLLAEMAGERKLTAREWNTSSPKLGWSLRVKRGDRIIVYLAPLHGCFRASFALGDKVVQAALASGLPKPVVKAIKAAKKYGEGTAVRIEVSSFEDIAVVKKLAELKLTS